MRCRTKEMGSNIRPSIYSSHHINFFAVSLRRRTARSRPQSTPLAIHFVFISSCGRGGSFDKYMADNRNGSKSAGIKGRDHLTATKRITAYKHNLTGIQRWNGVFLFIFSQLTMLQDKRLPSSGSRPDEMILRPFVLTETRCESSRLVPRKRRG